MPPVMFSVVTKYHKGRHSLFLYNLEIFLCAYTRYFTLSDEHKTFISDLKYSFENKQLGKIDTFKIEQLIESLNKAG